MFIDFSVSEIVFAVIVKKKIVLRLANIRSIQPIITY